MSGHVDQRWPSVALRSPHAGSRRKMTFVARPPPTMPPGSRTIDLVGMKLHTIAAVTLAELRILLRRPDRASYCSNAELTGAASVLLRVACLSVAITLVAQGVLFLAAAGALGRLTLFPSPMDLRRVALDPVWVITGVLIDFRGDLFIAAGLGAMFAVSPVFVAWLSRALTNAPALGSHAGHSPEDAILRAAAGSAGSILILMVALSFGTGWSRALLATVLPGAGFVATLLVLRRLWIAMGGERRPSEPWRRRLLSPGVALWLCPLALVAATVSISAIDCGWRCTEAEALIARAGSPSTYGQLSRSDANLVSAYALNGRYALAGLLSVAAGVLLIPVGLAAAGTVRQINSMQDALRHTLPQPTARLESQVVPLARRFTAPWHCDSCDFRNSPAVRLCQNCGHEPR